MMNRLISSTIRLMNGEISSRMISTNVSYPTCFWVSLPLLAEPMKKKKKMDPAILKAREERRKKRIEKSIKRLERNTKQLKPLEEIDFTIALEKEKSLRFRKMEKSAGNQEMALVLKRWSQYKYQQHLLETQMIDRITTSQSKALEQLKAISEELYIAAIQIDETLVPFSASGPKQTPAIEGFQSLDGEYVDETPKWE